jgi:hypothetical protein
LTATCRDCESFITSQNGFNKKKAIFIPAVVTDVEYINRASLIDRAHGRIRYTPPVGGILGF